MTEIDRYITARGHLPHPIWQAMDLVCARLGVNLLAPADTRVRHMSGFESRLSGRGSPTPAYVRLQTVKFLPDVLGYRSDRWGDWRFWHPSGLAMLFHEYWHVHQCVRDGSARMLAAYAGGVIRSLPSGGVWNHKAIPIEREASAMQARFEVAAGNDKANLLKFKDRWL